MLNNNNNNNTHEDDFINESYITLNENNDDIHTHVNPSPYAILNQADLIQRQKLDVTNVATLLSIPKHTACTLLLHYKWNTQKLHDAWFDDEAKVRQRVGLLHVDSTVTDVKTVTCGICFESVRAVDTATCGCDHLFCRTCWKAYICMAINDGPGCLTLRCPGPFCVAAVGPDMVNKLVTGKEGKRYRDFMIGSYVEGSYNIKWCPGPGCGYAVLFDDDFETGGGYETYDVTCVCKHAFCWKCMEEVHRPVTCETVAEWMVKITSGAENMNWIMAYTKPCPKCKRPIEKIDEGCRQMTCRPPCGYEFCWICLGPNNRHDRRVCDRYSTYGKPFSETEQKRVEAKKVIEGYMNYYERWDANERSRKEAGLLSLDAKLWFLKEAWMQIVECRRVLKWTYAYGYYIPDREHAKMAFLEYMQGKAEEVLERIHSCAEMGLKSYTKIEPAKEEEFNRFRVKLASLTSVTRSYFENLVRSLENGLAEVDSSNSRSGLGQGAVGGSSGKDRMRKWCGPSKWESDLAKRMRHATEEARPWAAGESSGRG